MRARRLCKSVAKHPHLDVSAMHPLSVNAVPHELIAASYDVKVGVRPTCRGT